MYVHSSLQDLCNGTYCEAVFGWVTALSLCSVQHGLETASSRRQQHFCSPNDQGMCLTSHIKSRLFFCQHISLISSSFFWTVSKSLKTASKFACLKSWYRHKLPMADNKSVKNTKGVRSDLSQTHDSVWLVNNSNWIGYLWRCVFKVQERG